MTENNKNNESDCFIPLMKREEEERIIKSVNCLSEEDKNSNYYNINEFELIRKPNSLKEFVDLFKKK